MEKLHGTIVNGRRLVVREMQDKVFANAHAL